MVINLFLETCDCATVKVTLYLRIFNGAPTCLSMKIPFFLAYFIPAIKNNVTEFKKYNCRKIKIKQVVTVLTTSACSHASDVKFDTENEIRDFSFLTIKLKNKTKQPSHLVIR